MIEIVSRFPNLTSAPGNTAYLYRCSCGSCQPTLPDEDLCCQEIGEMAPLLRDRCVTRNKWFRLLCLHKDQLEVHACLMEYFTPTYLEANDGNRCVFRTQITGLMQQNVCFPFFFVFGAFIVNFVYCILHGVDDVRNNNWGSRRIVLAL